MNKSNKKFLKRVCAINVTKPSAMVPKLPNTVNMVPHSGDPNHKMIFIPTS